MFVSVNRITQKLLITSSWNFMDWLNILQGPIEYILIDVDLVSLEVKRSKSFFSANNSVQNREIIKI